MLKAKVVKAPKQLIIPSENEILVIATGSEKVRQNVERRLRKGLGANGVLPQPKDGGKPLMRSGRLANNITYHLKQSRKGAVMGIVTASGLRPKSEIKAKDFDARMRQKAARDLALVSGEYGGRRLKLRRVKSKHSASGFVEKYNTGRIKIRAAVTNHNLAAILSLPAKAGDKRGYNGNRKAYVVFDENIQDIQDFVRIVKDKLKPGMK